MEPTGHLLEKVELENGLEAHFYDQSRKVAGDRWQVHLLLHVPMEVKKDYFRDCPDPEGAHAGFTAALGEKIAFEQERVRNFIDQQKMQDLLELMKSEVLERSRAYLSKPHFAERYVLRTYQAWEKQEALERARREFLK
jgi:hypothetical protein